MNDKWRLLGEFVGLTAVVGSLVFVGIQIQQGAEATRSATVLQLKDAWVQVNLTWATSVELAEAFESARQNGIENVSAIELEMIGGMDRTTFHNLANAYYQFRIGTLEEEQWIPHLNEINTVYQFPTSINSWEKWKFLYDVPFQELMDNAIYDTSRQQE